MIKNCGIVIGSILMLIALGFANVIAYDAYQQYAYKRLAKRAMLNPVKVFQIGFSKCATSSIAELFNKSGVPAIHHDFGNLALSMHENAVAGLPLISKQYAEYYFFTDMENMYNQPIISIGPAYFKLLDQQYPGSKFIFNTRDKQAWLKSRSKHKLNGVPLLAVIAQTLKLSEAEVLALWSQEWDNHHSAVLEYFAARSDDLLVFNIDSDSSDKLVTFFKGNFVLNPKYYTQKNKTIAHTAKDEERVEAKELFSKTYQLKADKLA